jgi:hypothetical protein
MALVVPIPQLQQAKNSSSALVSEKMIALSCSPVLFPDGTSLTARNSLNSTYLMYRQDLGGSQEVWDNHGKVWTAPSPAVTPQSLFWNDKAQSWQAIIVAMGNADNAGNPTFATDPTTGFPKYVAQCFFSGKDSTGTQQDGQSPFSLAVTILAPGQNNVAGLTMDPQPPDPTSAKDIYLFLKDSTFTTQGQILISQDSAGFHVQLIAGGASVVVSNTGEIVLSPANSQTVRVNGDIAVSGKVLIAGIPVVAP